MKPPFGGERWSLYDSSFAGNLSRYFGCYATLNAKAHASLAKNVKVRGGNGSFLRTSVGLGGSIK